MLRIILVSASALALAACDQDPTMSWCKQAHTSEQCSCLKAGMSLRHWEARRRIIVARQVGGRDLGNTVLVNELGADQQGILMYVSEVGLAEQKCLPTRQTSQPPDQR